MLEIWRLVRLFVCLACCEYELARSKTGKRRLHVRAIKIFDLASTGSVDVAGVATVENDDDHARGSGELVAELG